LARQCRRRLTLLIALPFAIIAVGTTPSLASATSGGGCQSTWHKMDVSTIQAPGGIAVDPGQFADFESVQNIACTAVAKNDLGKLYEWPDTYMSWTWKGDRYGISLDSCFVLIDLRDKTKRRNMPNPNPLGCADQFPYSYKNVMYKQDATSCTPNDEYVAVVHWEVYFHLNGHPGELWEASSTYNVSGPPSFC
jgi:hypothetical protein